MTPNFSSYTVVTWTFPIDWKYPGNISPIHRSPKCKWKSQSYWYRQPHIPPEILWNTFHQKFIHTITTDYTNSCVTLLLWNQLSDAKTKSRPNPSRVRPDPSDIANPDKEYPRMGPEMQYFEVQTQFLVGDPLRRECHSTQNSILHLTQVQSRPTQVE